MSSFTQEVNPRLAKRQLKTNGRLANLGLTSLVKEATGIRTVSWKKLSYKNDIVLRLSPIVDKICSNQVWIILFNTQREIHEFSHISVSYFQVSFEIHKNLLGK